MQEFRHRSRTAFIRPVEPFREKVIWSNRKHWERERGWFFPWSKQVPHSEIPSRYIQPQSETWHSQTPEGISLENENASLSCIFEWLDLFKEVLLRVELQQRQPFTLYGWHLRATAGQFSFLMTGCNYNFVIWALSSVSLGFSQSLPYWPHSCEAFPNAWGSDWVTLFLCLWCCRLSRFSATINKIRSFCAFFHATQSELSFLLPSFPIRWVNWVSWFFN